MIKHVFVGFIHGVEKVVGERWYFRYHSKEVVRFFGPWLRRYETYPAQAIPPGSERFGVVGGRLTELWYDKPEDMLEADVMRRPYTMLPPGTVPPGGMSGAVTIVPAMPTEDFLGREPTPEEVPIMRWYQAIKYPAGVSLEDGEKWFLETHSQEAKEQPGLLRYSSHRAIDLTLKGLPGPSQWLRVNEMWYENLDAWRTAIESTANYTPPPWGGEYPFVDMASSFIGYKPDVDYLKDHPFIP